jgi:FKBP-type peptidyl-prolyl cis-trans isomerase FkpA
VKADGLKVATVTTGSGPAIAAGQTASMLYTGYLFHRGTIFDNSAAHGGSPFKFTLKATPEQVIAGFDEGALGMQIGETRVLVIPSTLGYGTTGSPPSIPANSKLVFLITLVGIS